MRKLSIAVLVASLAVLVALTGCGGGGGGGSKGNDPTPTGHTIVSGTVVDTHSPSRAVKDVVITMGSMQTTTDANGKFRFDLGVNVSVSSVFSDLTKTYFKVSTRLLNQAEYPQIGVFYPAVIPGTAYEQIAENGGASIPLPFEVLYSSGVTKDLGKVYVQWMDPNNPPIPPF